MNNTGRAGVASPDVQTVPGHRGEQPYIVKLAEASRHLVAALEIEPIAADRSADETVPVPFQRAANEIYAAYGRDIGRKVVHAAFAPTKTSE